MNNNKTIPLAPAKYESEVSVEKAIFRRRSARDYKAKPITFEALSQLLWSAQGITETENKFRAAPSAGALYPLEIYVAVSKVYNLSCGVYKYDPHSHSLEVIKTQDVLLDIVEATYRQEWIAKSSIVIGFAANMERTTRKYGTRGVQYVLFEVGHSSQNVYLQAVSLGLGTVAVGAFNDSKIHKVFGMLKDEIPLYLMPVGVQ